VYNKLFTYLLTYLLTLENVSRHASYVGLICAHWAMYCFNLAQAKIISTRVYCAVLSRRVASCPLWVPPTPHTPHPLTTITTQHSDQRKPL